MLDSRVVVTLDGTQPSPDGAPARHLAGTWRETVASVDGGRTRLVVSFIPSVVPPETLSLEELSRPFAVALGEDDHVVGVEMARGVSAEARQALRSVVAGRQLSRARENTSARRWLAAEEATTGLYSARYEAASDVEIVKQKSPYASVVSPDGLAPVGEDERYDLASVTRYGLDDAGALASVSGRETLRIETGPTSLTLTGLSLFELRLSKTGRGAAPKVESGLAERLATFSEAGDEATNHDGQMARGADWATLLDRLAEIARMDEAEGYRAASHAIVQARAVLRLSPDAAIEAGRMLADTNTPPLTAAVLGASLAAADTEEARESLIDLTASDDPRVREAGASQMMMLRNADDTTVSALKAILDDADGSVASAASLALGANVRTAGGADASPTNAAAIEELVARYYAAEGDSERLTLIEALGNAGGAEASPSCSTRSGARPPSARRGSMGSGSCRATT